MRRELRSARSLLTVSLSLTLLVMIGLALAQPTAVAQDDGHASHPAHLHTGTCDAPGDVVFPLSNVGTEMLVDGTPTSDGTSVGAGSAVPVESSQSTVDAALADVAAGGHTLVVHESDEAIDNYIACGDVGGMMMGPSDLAFGLNPLNDSGYSGVAWMRDNGDGTTMVTVFLTGADGGADTGAVETSAPAAVAIEDFAFNPQTIEIAVGDTITWTNNDGASHTATQSGGGFQSGTLAQGATFSQTFDTAGSFDYYCEFHANMTGTVVVS